MAVAHGTLEVAGGPAVQRTAIVSPAGLKDALAQIVRDLSIDADLTLGPDAASSVGWRLTVEHAP